VTTKLHSDDKRAGAEEHTKSAPEMDARKRSAPQVGSEFLLVRPNSDRHSPQVLSRSDCGGCRLLLAKTTIALAARVAIVGF